MNRKHETKCKHWNVHYLDKILHHCGGCCRQYWNVFAENVADSRIEGKQSVPFHNLFVESSTWPFHLLNASCRANNNRALIVIPLICISATTYPCLPVGLAQLLYSKHVHTVLYGYLSWNPPNLIKIKVSKCSYSLHLVLLLFLDFVCILIIHIDQPASKLQHKLCLMNYQVPLCFLFKSSAKHYLRDLVVCE